MEESFLKSSRAKLLTLVFGVLVIILLVLHIINSNRFRPVSTNPSTSSVSYITPFFVINYNKPLSSKVHITSSPGLVRSYNINGETINISLNSMKINSNYFIDIKSVTATNGGVSNNKVFKFTAKNISFSNLPKDQQKVIINNQDKYPSPLNNPITAHLPYSTINYDLNAVISKDSNGEASLVIQANIFLSEADMSNESQAVSNYKQDIDNYIESFGLNPNNYSINYSTNTP